MSFNAAFDVVVAMTFVYLLLSLICTSANECLASLLRLRARNLYSELARLVDDPEVRASFWKSGLISSLGRSENKFRSALKLNDAAGLAPSYIPRDIFVAALIDAVRKSKGEEPPKSAAGFKELVDKISEDSLLRSVLQEITEAVEDDLSAIKTGVGEWFDRSMDRTTGVYKRNLQAISFIVALFLVLAINADSLAISRAVWFDDTLRAQMTASASEFVQQGGSKDAMENFQQTQHELRPVPIGWDLSSPKHTADWMGSVGAIFAKIIGLLLTAFAMTLGAPFWFDLLSRFVKLRGVGPNGDANSTNAPAGGK